MSTAAAPDATAPLPPPAFDTTVEWERGEITRERPRLPSPPRRPNVPYVLPGAILGGAAFLLFMSALLPAVVAPRTALLPLAPYTVVVAEGSGSYFAPSQGHLVVSDTLTSRLTIRGDLEAGSDQVAVWDTFTALEDLRPGVGPRDRVVSAVRERVALDRRTAQPVDCCDQDPVHKGLTYRFPFGTEPGEYLVWDAALGAGRPARFVRADRVGSLHVLVFASRVEPTQIGSEVVPGPLVGSSAPSLEVSLVHAAHREMWVEPQTGRIVRQVTDVRQTMEHAGQEPTPYATLHLAWNDETVTQQARLATREVARMEGVSSTLPLTAVVAGGILAAVGIILMVLAHSARQDG